MQNPEVTSPQRAGGPLPSLNGKRQIEHAQPANENRDQPGLIGLKFQI
jgi:hypothetical protein